MLLVGTTLGAGAWTEFDDDQGMEIDSDSYNQVLTYVYGTGAIAVSDVRLGEREFSLRVYKNDFSGAFCYDYALGRFTEVIGATRYAF